MDQKQLTQAQKATLFQLRKDLENVLAELQKMESDVESLLKREKEHVRDVEKIHGVTEAIKTALEKMVKKDVDSMNELNRINSRVHQIIDHYYVLKQELLGIIDPLEEEGGPFDKKIDEDTK